MKEMLHGLRYNSSKKYGYRFLVYKAITFGLLMVCWIIFSGKLDIVYLTMGALSAALVTWMSGDLIFEDQQQSFKRRFREFYKLILYSIWLLWEITLANIEVMKLVMQPKVIKAIDPQIITFETTLKSDFARFLLANSITLTPGTVTIKIEGDTYYVHALSDEIAEDCHCEMEKRLADIFENPEDDK